MNKVEYGHKIKELCSNAGNIFYVPCEGNAGDNIITVSTIELLNSIGLKYTFILPSEVFKLEMEKIQGSCFIVGGGGGLVPNYSSLTSLLSHLSSAKRIIQLSQTASGIDEFLEGLGGNYFLFLRESTSYDYVKSLKMSASYYKVEDLVFYTELASWRSKNKWLSYSSEILLSPWKKNICRSDYLKSKLLVVKSILLKAIFRVSQAMTLFRTDSEGLGRGGSGNIDISNAFNYGQSSKALIYESANDFVNFLECINKVKTDRLHVAITAAKLGKSVEFYGGNYHKCRSVYVESMENKFKNVRWSE